MSKCTDGGANNSRGDGASGAGRLLRFFAFYTPQGFGFKCKE